MLDSAPLMQPPIASPNDSVHGRCGEAVLRDESRRRRHEAVDVAVTRSRSFVDPDAAFWSRCG
jgi:hypothetical protein